MDYHRADILDAFLRLRCEGRAEYAALFEFSGSFRSGRSHPETCQNNASDGGRPNCNYYHLFDTILYGFAFDGCTLRQLETKCRYDLRYIHPMHRQRVDYSTFAWFIKNVIAPNEHEIFAMVCRQIVKELDIKLEDAFVDGTKLEANANKYKFEWKPTPRRFAKTIRLRV